MEIFIDFVRFKFWDLYVQRTWSEALEFCRSKNLQLLTFQKTKPSESERISNVLETYHKLLGAFFNQTFN